MKRFVFWVFLLIGLLGCKKETLEKTDREKLIGVWKFKVEPAKLINPWEGHCCEDRTVFSGKEHLGFDKDGVFRIDTVKYGVWMIDSVKNIIIDMTSSGGYAVGNYPQTMLVFKVIELNDTILKVMHDFYRFDSNIYILARDE